MRILPLRQCSPPLAPITMTPSSLWSFPRRRGLLIPAQSYRRHSTPSRRVDNTTPYSRTKHKAATPCSLTLSRPNLTLTLSKLVLKPLDMITKHYGGLYIFFNVYELPLDSRWANKGIINSPTTPTAVAPTATQSIVVLDEPILCLGGCRIIRYPFSATTQSHFCLRHSKDALSDTHQFILHRRFVRRLIQRPSVHPAL